MQEEGDFEEWVNRDLNPGGMAALAENPIIPWANGPPVDQAVMNRGPESEDEDYPAARGRGGRGRVRTRGGSGAQAQPTPGTSAGEYLQLLIVIVTFEIVSHSFSNLLSITSFSFRNNFLLQFQPQTEGVPGP